MTKRVFFKFWLLLVMGMTTMVFNSCGKEDNSGDGILDKKDTSAPESVMINGVRWAICNVDAPGKFAATPEAPGMFYQWNRPKAWSATGDLTDWDNTASKSNTWERANDPSPAGYHVPTKDEISSLLNIDKVNNEWVTQNGVVGRKFTDKATGNSIFLPAVSYLDSNGALGSANLGYYWSSSLNETNDGYNLYFLENNAASRGYSSRSWGLPIRSVAE